MTTSSGADLLATIVAAATRITAVRERARPARDLERQVRHAPDGAAFAAAVRGPAGTGARIIAECKRRSPSKGILRQDYDPAAHARAYAGAGAVAISVLTEPTFFDGAPAHLEAVRAAVRLPILRKDFVVCEYQLLEAAALGADAVLLIVGALPRGDIRRLIDASAALGLAALVEVHDRDELRTALDEGARIVGVNSRNLRTLAVDPRVHDALALELPREITAVAESGIRSSQDLARLASAGYHAFLVGERLMTQPDPGAALRALRE